jgi:hypothetical protein
MAESHYDVFVSHSARGVADHRDCLVAIAKALRETGYSVFLDQDTEVDEPLILPKLESAISAASIGVLLVSERSDASGWVAAERTMFRHRQAAGRFDVVGIMLEANSAPPATLDLTDILNASVEYDLPSSVVRVVTRLLKSQTRING